MTDIRSEDSMSLAAFIARKIFECPASAKKDSVRRIAFKGHAVAGAEPDYGGLCEEALVAVISRAVEEYRRL